MSSSIEKSIKGATKSKLAAPKSKYVQHILQATRGGAQAVDEIFRTLTHRIRDSTWIISFKALIVVHLMIREGEPDLTLKHLCATPRVFLAVNNYTDIQTQGRNIRYYSQYLVQRARSYAITNIDYVQSGRGRLKKLTVEKGLLMETESVQDVIQMLIQCETFAEDSENEITLTAYRLLTMDLLVLFNVMNEATINVLEHFFDMSKPDAERALLIYRTFVRQTDATVQFLTIARRHEGGTRVEIPKIKHAPTTLASSLEDYVNDADFEINRRQFLVQKEAKKNGKPALSNSNNKPSTDGNTKPPVTRQKSSGPTQASTGAAEPQQKVPAPDLIDFFDSIEQYQQPTAAAAYQQAPVKYPQQSGYAAQPQQSGCPSQYTGISMQQSGFQSEPQQLPFTQQQSFDMAPAPAANPFGLPMQQTQYQPLQSQFTGAGFGGYTTHPQNHSLNSQQASYSIPPQDSGATFNSFQPQSQPAQQPYYAPTAQQIQPQPTNPFRQSPTTSQATGSPLSATNPFARQSSPPPHQMPFQTAFSPASEANFRFTQHQTQSPQLLQPQPPQPLQPQPTGTNPFARSISPRAQTFPQAAELAPNVTGSTNPFRQSAFVNQNTGQGWQHGPQGTMGGFEQLETRPVFPRPGQMF